MLPLKVILAVAAYDMLSVAQTIRFSWHVREWQNRLDRFLLREGINIGKGGRP